ncbi:MAG TPA: glycosyltransferase family 87 protein [Gemmataceae bacterium]|nr:glycosyltransferase family 87 protein [Gemmataceae bacterium]
MHSLAALVERRLERGHVRFAASAVLGVSLLLLIVSVATTMRGGTVFGPSLGADYAAFYTAGTILNHYSGERLYDLHLQDRLFHELFPRVPEGEILPYANPPFLAGSFRLLARLPYAESFLVWLLISGGLYLAGLILLLSALRNIPATDKKLIVLIALSFEPFIMECWLGGQLSAIGFFCLALALYFERHGHSLACGLALGCCLYKPTLLPLVLLMLFLGRRWRILSGFGLMAAILAVASWLVAGPEACRDYGHLMLGYFSAATGSQGIFRLWKFVDLNTFFKLLGLSAGLARLLVMTVALSIAPLLLHTWWTVKDKREEHRTLVWAGTIAATLVLNIYVGVYDSILVVLAALLTVDILCRRHVDGSTMLPPGYRMLLVLLYLTPWLSQGLARLTGVQAYTVVLAVVAGYPLWLARKRVVTSPGPLHSAHVGF